MIILLQIACSFCSPTTRFNSAEELLVGAHENVDVYKDVRVMMRLWRHNLQKQKLSCTLVYLELCALFMLKKANKSTR